jgi:hypothetical protein
MGTWYPIGRAGNRLDERAAPPAEAAPAREIGV